MDFRKLLNAKVSFDYRIEGKLILIEDKKDGKSVTNGANSVLKEIAEKEKLENFI